METVKHPADRTGRSYLIRYTILFLITAALVFLPFVISRRSLVNHVDGMSQYVVYLRYMGQYLRSAVSALLHGRFPLPDYDFSIGMGDDIGQIVRFHPLDFLSVFVPARYTEYLYDFILVLRFYLAGLTFSLFAFSWNRAPVSGAEEAGQTADPVNVLSGSMVYVFCGFMLIRVANHPIYAAPFIVLPLLLLGAERVMRREGYALFPFAVFLGFWSNYYFMYIMSAALLVYVLVRFPEVVREDRIRGFFRLFFRMTGLYLLGTCMSMMTLLPAICRFMSSARISQTSETHSMLFYADHRRYFAWFLNLISPFRSSGNGTDLNFAVTVLPCLAVLFTMKRKEHRALKRFLVIDLLILLVPALGYVLAGFNNENNRWIFLIALCLGMTVVFTADRLADPGKRAGTAMLLVSAAFLLGVLLQSAADGFNIYNAAAAVQLAACMAVLHLPVLRRAGVGAVRRAVLCVTCLSVVLNAYMTYAPGFGNVVSSYVEAGRTMSRYDSFWRSRAEAQIEDDSFYRVEGFRVRHGRDNSAEYSDYNSTSEYNSILNADLLETMIGQGNIGLDAVTIVKGFDARPVSLDLAHVTYFIARSADSGSVPYGFSKTPVADTGDVQVYENESPLSFGYSYDAYITREDYDQLGALEKEAVQLDAAVLDEQGSGGEDISSALAAAGLRKVTEPSAQISSADTQIPQSGEGFVYEDGLLQAQAGACVPFSFRKREGCDAYLLLTGLRGPSQTCTVRLLGEGFTTAVNLRSSRQMYNIGREDYLFHLGWSETDGDGNIALQFLQEGDYDLSSASVCYVPLGDYDSRIAALNESSLTQEHIEDGRITGSVTLDRPKVMAFSLLSQRGWTLKVDGSQQELMTVNGMYTGALLPEGTHEIELTYRTPGEAAGTAAAVPAILLWAVLALALRRRNRTKDRSADAREQGKGQER